MGRDSLAIDVEKGPAVQPSVVEVPPRSSVSSARERETASARPGLNPSSKFSFQEDEVVGYDTEANTRTSLGVMYDRVWNFRALLRWCRHFFPVAAILAIPLALFATVYWRDSDSLDEIHLVGLFIWIEALWASLWVAKVIAMIMPLLFVFVAGIVNSGTRKYHPVVRLLETPIGLFFWTIIAETTVVPICMVFDKHKPVPEWLYTLRKVCIASIAVAAMVLVQRFIIQIINITYSEKQFSGRIAESKRKVALLDMLYSRSTELNPPFASREFAGFDYTIITGEVEKESSPSKLLADLRLAGREVAQLFGNMTSDITGASLFNTQAAHTIVTEALEATASSEALACRIWRSFAKPGAEAVTLEDLERAFPASKRHDLDELFPLMDVDQNGDISEQEAIMWVVRVGQERIDIWRSTHDLKSAVKTLDRLLQCVVVVGFALIYAAFFSQSFSTYLATIGTQLAAISFAIATTVQEFLGSCIFIFVKHPFDVGDRVRIEGQELIVERISLLYSVFKTLQGVTVQFHNIKLNSSTIENLSRSGAMRERITLLIAADTSFEDVEYLKEEIQTQLQAPENRRDFKEDVDVELVSIGDMSKMELCIETEHKSNWMNERLRRTRRNKLMTAVISSLRAIPIHGPGGGAAALGDEARPTYQVVVGEDVAAAAKKKFKDDAVAKKLHQPAPKSPEAESSSSSSIEGPSTAGLTQRRIG